MTINPAAIGFKEGLFRRHIGSAVDWLEKHFKIPHSARSTKFDRNNAPHLTDIIEACCDLQHQKVVVRACTGAGKTTVMEAVSHFAIGVEPGPMLIAGSTDKDIKDWAESRLIPELKECSPIAAIMDGMDRHDKRKTEMLFPHMSMFLTGANISGLQAKSMRYCYGDETWLWDKGMVGEMKARHHDRWNRKTILVTQGWETDKELPHDMDKEYEDGDDRRRGFDCPSCGRWQVYKWEQIKWDEQKIPDTDTLDMEATKQTVRYECEFEDCVATFVDTSENRRKLAMAGSYRPFNPHPMSRVTSFTCPAWAVWWIPWGDLVMEWIDAHVAKHKGDIEPLKKFTMKRAARVWEVSHTRVTDADVTSMRTDEYAMKQCPIDPALVTLCSDVGEKRTHWSVQAWAKDGTSYVIDHGTVLGPEDLLMLIPTLNYPIKGTDRFAQVQQGLIDSGDFTELVYNVCLRSNGTLYPSKGSGAQIGTYRESRLDNYGGLPLYLYSDYQAKCALYESKIAKKDAPRLFFASDVGEEFLIGHMGQRKIDSQDKKTKSWKSVAQDHYGDCSKLHLVTWWILRRYIEGGALT
jgi:phage terminase large subunit GpA-like protein